MTHHPNRRAFLGTAAATALAAPMAQAQTLASGNDAFTYEVTRTDAEWRAMLSEDEYRIMREFGTEPRFSSDFWDTEDAGHYHCKGCDLTIYDSDQKTLRLIGWVFYYHARPDSVLLGIDEWPAQMSEAEEMGEPRQVTEVHCRRCGSHLGHLLQVQGDMLHCINGASLTFAADEAG
ncbi:peptide-methionine (R)-S-oxide reductase [Hasllibacter sp. MH4015]|uniref:peptide-methionine (R)-S-oxide reductase n=1 Tax=Hasllibacter sp. MH4015 TaxID=2854029 RepID=UPI001CD3F8AE|nr:peptide-methionine (R)-S-oxide reductase [Hasllibacter sp. MH4015]